jgi:aryl-alcohol dehydrogenase-like predicted oxidoreductase
MEYSPFVLDIERTSGTNILATCRELGVAVVCYSPLGRGLLTGALTTKESISGPDDIRASYFPRFNDANLEKNVDLVYKFKTFADKKHCTTSQLALAWLLKQGNDIFPIPGTKKIRYLNENWNSLDVHLTDAEEVEIRNFVENAEMLGFRDVPVGKSHAFVDTVEES